MKKSESLVPQDKLAKSTNLDLVKAVAHDIGKEVAHHIAVMYPEAVQATSSTFLLSVRGCVYNEIMSWMNVDADATPQRLMRQEQFRRYIRAAYRKIREQP